MTVFIVSVDGPDYCGKSTVCSLLIEKLKKKYQDKIRVKHTRLPSGLITGSFTKILRNSKDNVSPEVFSLAYALDHLHHNRITIEPLVKDDIKYVLVQERSVMTTLLYQGVMLGADMEWLNEINKHTKYLPDLSVILDVDVEELIRRKNIEKRNFDVLEKDEYIRKQVKMYRNIPDDLKKRFNVVYVKSDNKDVTQLTDDVCKIVTEWIGKKFGE